MNKILLGDCLESLKTLPDQSVHCCVTSPPYFGLRNYNHVGQIGLEQTPEEFVAKLVDVFREVRRVLRDDGSCWVNLGDSYTPGQRGKANCPGVGKKYRLRSDLSPHEVLYVLEELAKHSRMELVTTAGEE